MTNCLKALIAGLLAVLFLPTETHAQDPEFSQFYANSLYLNPAFAGTARCPRFSMGYRNQWPALAANYVTTIASYDQHVETLSGGVGLMVMNDVAGIGTLTTTSLSGIYSYQQAISREFSLKAGLQVSYFQKKLDWSRLSFGDQIDPRRGFIYESNDQRKDEPVSNVDFSFGVLGFSDKFFIGAAIHHLNEPNESVVLGEAPLPMKFTGHAGAVIPIEKRRKDSDASLSPNVLFRHQGEFTQLNLGLYVNKGPLVGGIWSRFNGDIKAESFIALAGIQTEVIRFGYSYDLTVNAQTPSTGGAHEVSLTIQFDCKPKRRSRLRQAKCPSF